MCDVSLSINPDIQNGRCRVCLIAILHSFEHQSNKSSPKLVLVLLMKLKRYLPITALPWSQLMRNHSYLWHSILDLRGQWRPCLLSLADSIKHARYNESSRCVAEDLITSLSDLGVWWQMLTSFPIASTHIKPTQQLAAVLNVNSQGWPDILWSHQPLWEVKIFHLWWWRIIISTLLYIFLIELKQAVGQRDRKKYPVCRVELYLSCVFVCFPVYPSTKAEPWNKKQNTQRSLETQGHLFQLLETSQIELMQRCWFITKMMVQNKAWITGTNNEQREIIIFCQADDRGFWSDHILSGRWQGDLER